MQLEVGEIINGKVKGITRFGAFIELDKNKMGLVHISEISNKFVKEVKDHLKEGQDVRAKIIKISNDGKIELSIKQLMPKEDGFAQKREELRKKVSADKFEDMINKFKRLSDEKLLDFKKKAESRRSRGCHKNDNNY